MKTTKTKRGFAWLLVVVMIVTMFTGSTTVAYATATEDQTAAPTAEPKTKDSDVDQEKPEEDDVSASELLKAGDDDAGTVSTDLADHIQTLEIVGDPESVAAGTNVTVKFGWLIKGAVHGGTDSFTYQLPVNFAIPSAATGRITKGAGGDEIGSYRVSTDGLVTITYDSTYNTSSQTTINYMEITGTAQYGADEDQHKIEFVWKDGSKVVVVTNPGDFTLEKSAVRTFPSGEISHNSVIEYTVTITSENGTNDTFTINDVLSMTDAAEGSTLTFDKNSFVLKNQNGSPVSINPTFPSDDKVTIANIPALAAGGTYTLTYKANFNLAADSNSASAKVSNTVTAKSGDVEKTDSKENSYDQVLRKDSVEYINATKRMRWQIFVRSLGTSLEGVTLNDTAEAEIVSDTFSVMAYFTDGTNNTYNNLFKIDPNDPKSFSVTFPEIENVKEWRIKYYTVVDAEPGTTVTVKNTSTLTNKEGETWTAKASHSGTVQGETTVQKNGLGYGEETDGYVPFYWNCSVTYADDVNKTSYEMTDKIYESEVARWNTDKIQWDKAAQPDDHYGIATEILEKIKETLRITVKENDVEKELTYDEVVQAGGKVEISFFSNTSANKTVSANDSSTHVKSMKLKISGIKPKKVTFDYTTRFDLSHYANGTTWRMHNQLSAETKYSDPYTQYTKELSADTGIDKQVKIGSLWTSSDYSFDYDDLSDGKLTFRLLATLAEDQSSLTVTDTLPEGFTIVDGSVKVGNYNKNKNSSDYTWTENENLTITYPSEENNKLTVQAENIGTELELQDENTVVIYYQVQVDSKFGKLSGATYTSDPEKHEQYIVSKAFTNTAVFGDKSDSLTTTVTRMQKVLDKTGEQIQENDANTTRVHYSVKVNPDALDLLSGSDELTLTDIMTSDALDFALDASSIKLYRMNEDGSKGDEVEPLGVDVQQPTTESGTTKQSFTIDVMDAAAYILEYDFIADKRAESSAATEGDFVNTIKLVGYASDADTTSVKGISVRATSNHAGLQLVKVDSKNNAKFLTAKFKLEKYNKGNWERVLSSFTISGKNGLSFDYYDEDDQLSGSTLYRIVEIEEPEGYTLDETPFYFIILGNVEDVRSGKITSTNLTPASQEKAKEDAGAPDDLDIHYLEPDSGSYFELKNVKAPESAKIQLTATKAMTGRALAAGEFSFSVKDESGATVATGTNDAEGNITFSDLIYTVDDVGTHTYTVTEDAGRLSGVTYDTSEFTVIVTVSETEDGTLSANPAYPEEGVVFHNGYTAAEAKVTLAAKKNYVGGTLQAGLFSFELKDDEGEVVETVKNAADGTVSFQELTFKETGAYNYTISEVNDQKKGVIYDSTVYDVKITITDDGEGKLLASVEPSDSSFEFNNELTVSVKVSKVDIANEAELAGAKLKITDASGKEIDSWISSDEEEKKVHEVTGLKPGEAYTLTEESAPTGYNAITTDIKFIVDENGNVTVTDKTGDEAKVNTSGVLLVCDTAKTASIELAATKTMTGRALAAGEFSFSVTDESGATVATGTNDADGKIAFSEINYTLADVGEHTYKITEDAGRLSGVTYDESEFEVTVTVSEDMDTSASYPEAGVNFSNSYQAEGEIALEATKSLEGRSLKDREFSFTAKEGETVVATGTNDADGRITFSEINYTQEDVGEHIYTITEDSGNKGGVSYSKESYSVTVMVSDNGDGTLAARAVYPENGVIFRNGYTAAETTVTLAAQKNYVSGTLKDDLFSFVLKDSDGEVVETVKNAADGTVAFSELTFKEAGEYNYTISEVNDQKTGVIYDSTVYDVKITVTDDEEGRLLASVEASADSLVFNNELTVSVKVSKVDIANSEEIAGAKLSITDASGNEIDSWTSSDAKGETIHEITGLKPGEEYTLSETAAPDGYDAITTDIKFTVDENGKVTVTANTAEAEFNADGVLLVKDTASKEETQSIKLTKVDSATGKALAGAELQIINPSGKVITTWTSKQGVVLAVKGLTVGAVYTIRETTAPTGYTKLKVDIKFTVDVDGNVTITGNTAEASVNSNGILLIKNTASSKSTVTGSTGGKTTTGSTSGTGSSSKSSTSGSNTKTTSSVKTGDTNTIGLYVLLMMAAAAVLVTAGILRRKRMK